MPIDSGSAINSPVRPTQETRSPTPAAEKVTTGRGAPVNSPNGEIIARMMKHVLEKAPSLQKPGDLAAELAKNTSQESPPPETHRVFVKGATPVFRFDKVFPGGGEAEFNALKSLYSVDPLHVAAPIQLNHDGQGVVTGYDMENVPGQTVSAYMESNAGALDRDLADQIRSTLQTFHENGLAHGDVNPHNIIISITPEGKRVIKFIDPVGWGGKIAPEDMQQYIDFDRQRLEEWLPSETLERVA